MDWENKDKLSQELSNILLKNEYSDNKIYLEGKEDMKRRIWRSPDIWDAIMMRMYFEFKKVSNDNTTVISVSYDNLLY